MRKVTDLTLTIHEGMQTFPTHWHPFVEITQLGRFGIEDRETRKITLGTHTGTHMDAPRHFIPGGETIENISLEQLCGKATLLDFSELPEKTEITPSMLEEAVGNRGWERLLVRFDWDKHLGHMKYYNDHPFFSEAACELMMKKGMRVIALDTPQPDNPLNGRGAEKDAPNHKIILGGGAIIVEYLTNIKELKSPELELYVAPLKIKDGDGAPVRCFAIEN